MKKEDKVHISDVKKFSKSYWFVLLMLVVFLDVIFLLF